MLNPSTIMDQTFSGCLLLILLLALLHCPSVYAGGMPVPTGSGADTVLLSRTGTASYYAARFHGRHTSNGEMLDNEAYTCASYLPYDTWVRVTHLRNGKSVVVRVTDRFRPGGKHLVDLTLRAAKEIDLVRHGVARIRMEVLNPNVVREFLPKDTITVPLSCPSGKFQVPLTIAEWEAVRSVR
jgi:rare lipoprotein A